MPFAELIRGRAADEALELLRFAPNRGAKLLSAVVKSALGNAEDRGEQDPTTLIVLEARIDPGPIMKRFMPRARGTAYPIKRRYAHIRVTIGEGPPEPSTEETTPETTSATTAATGTVQTTPESTQTASQPNT
jgi:large subunit ribosomal protein L22